MDAIDVEKLNQLVARTDISGNDKVRWLEDFISGRELQQQERMYGEEEFKEIVYNMVSMLAQANNMTFNGAILNELFNKFKKK